MKRTLKYLLLHGVINDETHGKLDSYIEGKPLSIFWHIRILLYLGVTLIATALGILIYENIDTIGHLSIVVLIGLTCIACFVYSFKKAPDISADKSEPANPWFDYIVLFGTLLFLTFEGYLQFQYSIFGERYGMATFLPAMVLFGIAYRFDHLGVLSLAITLFCSWLGISLTPKSLFTENDFSTTNLVITGMLLCVILIGAGYYSVKEKFKAHFHFTYYNFGMHLGAVAILAAGFNFSFGWIWMLLISPLILFAYWYSQTYKSFYFLLFGFGYTYIAISYIVVEVFIGIDSDYIFSAYLLMTYFIATAIYAIKFLRSAHKKMNEDAGV
ncbi:MAG: DUF2157 domain-containing protein [Fulvivirga sp.]|uniref:DUF2157 domain-containing protein n=1 Tax=Fulvivirga sp. TaxID=1931237 RepID=UPI0032F06701